MTKHSARQAAALLIAVFGLAQAELAAAADGPNETPLPLKTEPAFPKLRFKRPIALTHAGDGSDRVFVASQLGTVHVFPNRQDVGEDKTFLDISSRVVYKDRENEEGFLGLAFHPKYKQNGEFFIYYTTTSAPHTSVISRFRVSKDDPDKADPDFEEELMRIPQPYWNHNGGTLCFGPDGYLYIGLGDGGSKNDPHGNGQNIETLLGDILRIDIDRRDTGLKYAIPKDNPFAGAKKGRDEIYAYGVRNIWRMSFDRETGALWAADVGQELWEEINIIVKGGNYGWNRREGMHPFGADGAEARGDLIDPIFEYHHSIGKSITGGHVYRGKRLPMLVGAYLYGDYVTGKIWALRYDDQKKQVTHNQPIAGNVFPIMSFGEDQPGDVYFMLDSGTLHRFAEAKKRE